MLNIVSFEVDSSIEVAFLIDCYFRVFFEGVEKMISVAHDYIFDADIINYEVKKDRLPFVAPQTRGLGELLVVVLEKACLQEVIGKAAGLRETIDNITDLKMHPALVYVFVEVILVDEILRDVGELDLY